MKNRFGLSIIEMMLQEDDHNRVEYLIDNGIIL